MPGKHRDRATDHVSNTSPSSKNKFIVMNYFKIKADLFAMKKAKRLLSVSNTNVYETDSFEEAFQVEEYLKKLKIEHTGVSKQIKK